jgi:hypothetical protein
MMTKKMVGVNSDIPWTDDQFKAWANDEVDVGIKHGLIKASDRTAQIAMLTNWWESKPYFEVYLPADCELGTSIGDA